MKVFISADIEGITTTTFWNETISSEEVYKKYALDMTNEVKAACEGAVAAGAKEIVIKDAHGKGNSIDINLLPKEAKLIRGRSYHPYSMVYGIDDSFDAAIFIGYHSAASFGGNPMSHTVTRRISYVKINDRIASEFMIYSLACFMEGVPTVFLSGDKALCEDSKDLYNNLITCPVKEGVGGATINYNPKKTLEDIKTGVEKALNRNLNLLNIKDLPPSFKLEICYKEHEEAEKFSYYPGVKRVNDNTILFETDDYFEMLRMFNFCSHLQ